MPLVRIDIRKGRPPGFGARVGAIVYRTMHAVMSVPADDNFQIIGEHDAHGLVYDPGYMGIPRTDGIVFVQITLSQGRSLDVKKAFYRELADRLHAELGVRREDVLINLVEVHKENWSFGNGVAAYA
ncbi:MAG TPA: tautomerase family protein [Haliangiales bacterium]|nr:tautomerase family protein [Haliangiales bacterium]